MEIDTDKMQREWAYLTIHGSQEEKQEFFDKVQKLHEEKEKEIMENLHQLGLHNFGMSVEDVEGGFLGAIASFIKIARDREETIPNVSKFDLIHSVLIAQDKYGYHFCHHYWFDTFPKSIQHLAKAYYIVHYSKVDK